MRLSQYGFVAQRGTTDVIFILRQYSENDKELYLVFVDLEKVSDRMP